MNTKLDFSIAMAERIVANINAGRPGFFGLWKEGNSVLLGTQRKILPVTQLKMDFTDGHTSYYATEENFRGQLLAGRSSDFDNVNIISFADEKLETIQFSSERNLLDGTLHVFAAVNQGRELQELVHSIAFTHGQGALYFGLDESLVQYVRTVSMLTGKPKLDTAGDRS